MRWLVAILLLASVSAFQLDGFCNYTAGESCMNSPDCIACNVSLNASLRYFDTYALLSVRIHNWEPEEVPLVLEVKKDGKKLSAKSVDLPAGGQKLMDVKVERGPGNSTLLVELRDRDIGTAWDYQSLILRGMESRWRLDLLIPVASVFAFIGILVYGLKQIRKGPYEIVPVFMPAYPPEPPPEEEVIIVPKKKKYYYRK